MEAHPCPGALHPLSLNSQSSPAVTAEETEARGGPGTHSWKTKRVGALFLSLWLHQPARALYTVPSISLIIRCGGTEFCFISRHKFCLVLLTPQGNLEILTGSFPCPSVFCGLFFISSPFKGVIEFYCCICHRTKGSASVGETEMFCFVFTKDRFTGKYDYSQ